MGASSSPDPFIKLEPGWAERLNFLEDVGEGGLRLSVEEVAALLGYGLQGGVRFAHLLYSNWWAARLL
jgi:hypothetical protein